MNWRERFDKSYYYDSNGYSTDSYDQGWSDAVAQAVEWLNELEEVRRMNIKAVMRDKPTFWERARVKLFQWLGGK